MKRMRKICELYLGGTVDGKALINTKCVWGATGGKLSKRANRVCVGKAVDEDRVESTLIEVKTERLE